MYKMSLFEIVKVNLIEMTYSIVFAYMTYEIKDKFTLVL